MYGVHQQIGLGADQQLGYRREARLQAVDHTPQLGPRLGLVGLLEDGANDGGDHAARRARHEVLRVAREVDAAALPAAPSSSPTACTPSRGAR